MAERYEVYKCEVCGNLVEVLDGEAGVLVCCGEDMAILKENTVDAAREKHVPVPHHEEAGMRISVGEVPHPMTEAHHIEWIEARVGNRLQRMYLKPGDTPEVLFSCPGGACPVGTPIFRAYCNLHGLWKAE